MSTEVTRNYVNTPSVRHNFDLGKNELWKWVSGNHSVHHLLVQRFINSYNDREQRQRTKEIFIGEVENSEFSENSETSEYQFPRFSTPSFRFCPIPPTYTQNRKLGIENLGVSLRHFDQTRLRAFPTPSFPFCTILKRKTRSWKPRSFLFGIMINWLQDFPTPSFPFCTILKRKTWSWKPRSFL